MSIFASSRPLILGNTTSVSKRSMLSSDAELMASAELHPALQEPCSRKIAGGKLSVSGGVIVLDEKNRPVSGKKLFGNNYRLTFSTACQLVVGRSGWKFRVPIRWSDQCSHRFVSRTINHCETQSGSFPFSLVVKNGSKARARVSEFMPTPSSKWLGARTGPQARDIDICRQPAYPSRKFSV